MTPELFNMVGAVLLVLLGAMLCGVEAIVSRKCERKCDSFELLGLLGVIFLVVGILMVMCNWSSVGQVYFGGER